MPTDMPPMESAWQTVGPFFHTALPWKGGGTIAGAAARGERVHLVGRILDGNREPVAHAMVEVWQADSAGRFAHPDDPRHPEADPAVAGFGRTVADADGVFRIDTVRPGRVPGYGNTWQAPHLAIAIFGRGLSGRLVSRVYFAGDPANAEDPVLDLIGDPARRDTLLAHPGLGVGEWHWTARLQGEDETVFFEV